VSSDAAITPLRRLKAALPYIVVLAAGLFLYDQAENFQFEQVSGRIGPGAWPKLILLLMLVTALWGIVSSAVKAGTAGPERAETEEAQDLARPPEIYPYRVWLAIAATLGYLLALPYLGFFLATTIYSFGLMYLGHFRRPVAIVSLSPAIALAFMFVFMRVVYVALPLGIAPFDKVSFALMAAMGVH
jgi:putative tricarboxylic transport membrane protein